MTLLAGLAVGVFVYFAVGFATGHTPEIRIRRFRRRTQISNRQLWLNQAGVEVANTHPYHSPSEESAQRSFGVNSSAVSGATTALQVTSPRAHRFGNPGIRHVDHELAKPSVVARITVERR
jgi:hypothetical protein